MKILNDRKKMGWGMKNKNTKANNRKPGWGRTPCRENKETKFVLKVF